MSKLRQVAKSLNITDNEAFLICQAVQRECGGKIPTYQTIADCLIAHPELRNNPKEIAQIIRETLIRPESVKGKCSKRTRVVKPIIHQTHPGVSLHEEYTTSSPIMSRDPRQYTDHLPKCPHGIPLFRTCAICDPKKFQQENNMD